MAIHVIADMYGVDPELIKRVEDIKPVLDKILAEAGMGIVSSSYHQFQPHGVSGVYLLRESHVSIHTWPEDGYVAIDVYYCGRNQEAALRAYEMIERHFRPERVEKNVITRVVPSEH